MTTLTHGLQKVYAGSWRGRAFFGKDSPVNLGPGGLGRYQKRLESRTDPEVKIWLQQSSSKFVRLSESVIAMANQQGYKSMGYTQVLRIEAWSVKLRFEY